MAYSTDHLRTAGKVTVYTTLFALVVFLVAFTFNIGEREIKEAGAQSNATTTVEVLNTPPTWTASTTEEFESSATNPTNEGSEISWVAIGTDSNAEDYYLLICSTSASPTPGVSGAAPTCSSGIQWAVSTATISGTQARAATTTTASTSPFAGEVFNWYAWICDSNNSNPTSARCSTTFTQGTNATNSSPFEVNHRPLFTSFWDNSPGVPGATITFTSTSSDNDISGVQDTVKLIVCATAGFNTLTDTCTGTLLGSTTVFATSNATATYTIVIPTQDQDYGAYGYVIDNHGLEATGATHGSNSVLSVANAAPTISGSDINLNGGNDMSLTVEGGETAGFTLSFVASDDNSCLNSSSQPEMRTFALSVYRNGTGLVNSSSSTCSMITGVYNPNNCYYSGLATSTWNLSCTASTTSCTGNTDTTQRWDCTFPLWFVADPTDGTATSTQYSTNDWRAQVQVGDDGQQGNLVTATSSAAESIIPDIEVTSFLAFALNTLTIPYGALEPGQQTDPLIATTTISATGNVGLDKDVIGTSMCTTYSGVTPCPVSATSTIPANEQRFATGTIAYGSAAQLSDVTAQEIEINVPKTTATSTYAIASAYWGIRVPATITFSGDYTGENTFTAIVGESANW